MAGKLSVKAQQQLDLLTVARRKLDRLHSLVEQYAATGQDYLAGQISRAGAELGRALLGGGYGVMADLAGQMGMTAKRGGATQSKFRALRDSLAQLRPAIDRAEKAVHADEAAQTGD